MDIFNEDYEAVEVEELDLEATIDSPRLEKFIAVYVETGVQAEAERQAGYASTYGKQLLADPRVKKRVTELRERSLANHEVTISAIVEQFRRIATLDPLEAYEFALAVETITIKHGTAKANYEDGIDIEQVRAELRAIPKEVRQLMDISFTAKGIQIKFPDKQRAVENLAKLTGAYAPEKIDLNVPLIGSINIIRQEG